MVRHALASLNAAEGLHVAELDMILDETGTTAGTGEPCTLSRLPMPRLVEWARRWSRDALEEYEQTQHAKGEAAEWGERDESGQHLKLMREFWVALRVAVDDGARGTPCGSSKSG